MFEAVLSQTVYEARLRLLESTSVYPVYGNPRTGLLRTFWERDTVPRSLFSSVVCVFRVPFVALQKAATSSSYFCQNSFAGLLLRQGENSHYKKGLLLEGTQKKTAKSTHPPQEQRTSIGHILKATHIQKALSPELW